MRKATLEPNAFLQGKQRFIVEGLPEANRIITRDTISMELGVIERPDKTVIPAGRVSNGEFNVKLDFGDNLARDTYVQWFLKSKDKGVSSVNSGSEGEVIGIDSDYKKTATIIYHRLYQEPGGANTFLKIRLFGCWIKQLTLPDFDMNGEDACELECAISYDDVMLLK